MVSTLTGADVGELRDLATSFESAADALDRSTSTLAVAIAKSGTWTGQDANAFRSRWAAACRPRLAAAAERLRASATGLRTNAAEQEHASAADGGASVSALGVSGAALGSVGLDPNFVRRMVDWEVHGVSPWHAFDTGFSAFGHVVDAHDGLTDLQKVLQVNAYYREFNAAMNGSGEAARWLSAEIGVANATGRAASWMEAGGVMAQVDKVATPLAYIGLGVDSFKLGYSIGEYINGDGSKAEIAWGAANVAADGMMLSGMPPLVVAGVAIKATDFVVHHREEIAGAATATAHGVSDAAGWAGDRASDAGDWAGHEGGKAVGALSHGGHAAVGAVKHLFG